MSGVNRGRETSRWSGQHHGGRAFRRLGDIAFIAAFLLTATPSLRSQSLLRIQVLEGEGVVNGAGTRSQRPIAVQLTDETGRPLEGIAVSFRLPEEGPGGAFESGMKTEIVITSPDGRAAVHGIRWNRIAGPFQVRITAAKGESRAGTICSQYISDQPVGKSSNALISQGARRKKWIAIAAIAAGGALAAGIAGRTGSSSPQVIQPPTPPATPVQVGPPTISISKN